MVWLRTKKVKCYYYLELVKSVREGKKVKHIVLKRLGRVLDKLPKFELKECAVCGAKEGLTIDHIIPLSKGETNKIENLQCLCLPCNQQKANKIDKPLGE